MAIPFPTLDPIAFHIGPVPVRWYALAYMAGFVLGWRYALRLAAKDGKISKTDIDDFLTWAILGVILGGRVGYVLFYQAHIYREDPMEILRVWHGGMSFHGGAAGVIIAMIIFAWKRKLPLLRLTDIICAVVPVGLFFGRIANFINGELWGRETSVPWAVVFPRAGMEPRHPSQLYEAGLEGLALGLLLFVLTRIEAVRNRPGIVSGVFLLGYAAARAGIEFFREPDENIGFLFNAVTMGQVLCAPMALGGFFLLFVALHRDSRLSAGKQV